MDIPVTSRQKAGAFSLCVIACLLAAGVAVAIGFALRDLHPLWMLLGADIGGTLVIYVFSRLSGNASFYDPYWSLAPMVIVLYWFFAFSPSSAPVVRQIAVLLLVLVWGTRLTFNWARQWRGLDHEDWRYSVLREKTGRWFWLVDLMGIELMPTLIVFMGCLPLYPALVTGRNSFNALDVIAILVTSGAIVLEATADEQLKRFIQRKPSTGAVITDGLWRYSRHPNYLGEILFWWGLFLFGLAASPGYWWMIIGPIMVTLLFTFISVPLMDKRNLVRRGGYQELLERIPALLPGFRPLRKRLPGRKVANKGN